MCMFYRLEFVDVGKDIFTEISLVDSVVVKVYIKNES